MERSEDMSRTGTGDALAWRGPAVGLLDLDAFFASVEQLDHPEWRGRPVIVGGSAERRGVVSTASYEARRFGVHSAMPSATARRLCPDAIWTQGNYARYREMSDRVMAVLDAETPLVEQVSIDEAFFDVTPGRFSRESPVEICRRVQRRVAELGVTCSIGIGVNKTVAKIASEREKLLHMEEELHKRVIGQEQAIAAISDAVRRSRAGLNDPRKPIGSFIFLGTTGVGKTELAKALAEFLFNDDQMMTRIDMSEYQERHAVSRLVGAPPGYVGYDEGGQLTEAVRRKPYSVVLLDEIEKAHPDVFNILLQVLDDGRLTDNKGRTVDFRNTIIIMTSNMGSQVIQDNFAEAFDGRKLPEEVVERTRLAVIDLLKQQLKPEFLNRIDEIVMFEPLTHKDIERIVDIQLGIVRRMLSENGIRLEYSDKAREWIASAGYDPLYGARPVKRVIQRYVVNDLSKRILAGEVDRSKPIAIDAGQDGLTFSN